MGKDITNQDDDRSLGQKIEILDGPWIGFKGVITSIDLQKKKVMVIINFWGKDTPVELNFTQIEPST
jgi:transcriptional antiterminator NusG